MSFKGVDLIKSFSVYTFSSLITAGIPFLVLPILTFYLTPEDYGTLRLFSVYTIIMLPFIGLNAMGLPGIEFFRVNKNEFGKLFSTVLRLPVLLTIFYSIIIFIFKEPIAKLIELPSEWIWIIPVIAFLTFIAEAGMRMLINEKRASAYAIFSITRTIIEVSLTLLLVVVFLMNWQGRVISWAAALFIFSIVSIVYFIRKGWLKNQFDKDWQRQSLMFGLPLIPHVIGRFVVNQSDIIFISKMVSIEATGIYGIGYQIGFLISILSAAFLNMYTPFINERLPTINYKKKKEIVNLTYFFVGGLITFVLLVSLLSGWIFDTFLDERYREGAVYVPWIAVSYLFWGGYSIFGRYIFYLKKTYIMTYLAILNVALNLGLNYFFILKFGTIGAAYATVISFFIVFISVMIISSRLYPMPWFYFMKKSGHS